MNIKTTPLLFSLVLLFSACGPDNAFDGGEGFSSSDSGTTSTDAFDTGEGFDSGSAAATWAEIRCTAATEPLPRCMGRPTGSDDAWVFVACEGRINEIINSGEWVKSGGWTDETCAEGLAPSNFLPDDLCVYVPIIGSSICYSGGPAADGTNWYTQVSPTCDVAFGDAPAWPAWQCDGDAGFVGQHPWDAVTCSEGEATACIAVDDADAMLVWPDCWVNMQPDVDVVC